MSENKDYKEEYILKRCRAIIPNTNSFYKNKIVNYTGKVLDKDEYYTEVISGFLLDNIDKLKNIESITRGKDYFTGTHKGHINLKKYPNGIMPDDVALLTEKDIAKDIFNKSEAGMAFNYIGKIIDYETPLNDKNENGNGNIDLLAYNEDTNILRILELKKPNSTETMLRCALESYTYLKTVDQEKLIENFKMFGTNSNTKIYACPFVFLNKAQHKEIIDGRPNLIRLMKELEIYPYYIDYVDGKYIIYEDELCKLK